MSSFTVVAKAKSTTEFEELSISKILKNWRKFQPLMTKILEANLFDCDYPEVEIQLEVEGDVVVKMEVSNIGTENRMQLLWPRLAGDGELDFRNLSYCLKANGRNWTLSFVEGGFSASTTEFKSKSCLTSRDGLDISGWFASIDALDKQALIRSLVGKMDVFFTYNDTFSPEQLADVLCQALAVNKKELKNFRISMGFCNLIKLKDGEITEAVELGKDYTICLNFQSTTYTKGKFSLCEESKYQRYRVAYEESFVCNALYLVDVDVKQSVLEAKDAICEFLCGIAFYNGNLKK